MRASTLHSSKAEDGIMILIFNNDMNIKEFKPVHLVIVNCTPNAPDDKMASVNANPPVLHGQYGPSATPQMQAHRDAAKPDRNTGFDEPFSLRSNTTLPHKDAITAPGGELDSRVIKDKKHLYPSFRKHHGNRSVSEIEADMYKDLRVVDADKHEKAQRGRLKRALEKLPCTH